MVKTLRILFLILICSGHCSVFSQKKKRKSKCFSYELRRDDYQYLEPYIVSLKDLGNDSISISGSTLKFANGGTIYAKKIDYEISEDGNFTLRVSKEKIRSGSLIIDFKFMQYDEYSLPITEFHSDTSLVLSMNHNGVFDPETGYINISSKKELSKAQQLEILYCICQRRENCYDPETIFIMYAI